MNGWEILNCSLGILTTLRSHKALKKINKGSYIPFQSPKDPFQVQIGGTLLNTLPVPSAGQFWWVRRKLISDVKLSATLTLARTALFGYNLPVGPRGG